MNVENKMRLERVVAILLIAVPGAFGVLGWKWMKDAIYTAMGQQSFQWGVFFSRLFSDWHLYAGFIFLLLALIFIGGFIFHRDAKRNRVQPKLRRNKDHDGSAS